MNNFTIESNDYLNESVNGWYNSEYQGGTSHISGRIENMICTLKNDINIKAATDPILQKAADKLRDILLTDFNDIKTSIDSELTVCVVPRAKVEYAPHQLLFKETVRDVVNQLGLIDGTDYLTRIKDTRTTHRNKAGYGGKGPLPYEGITKDTCAISNQVMGKTILLIDDVYTPSVNIDEDAIQALLDNGAARVIFYALGHTV